MMEARSILFVNSSLIYLGPLRGRELQLTNEIVNDIFTVIHQAARCVNIIFAFGIISVPKIVLEMFTVSSKAVRAKK